MDRVFKQKSLKGDNNGKKRYVIIGVIIVTTFKVSEINQFVFS